ncbi:MAG: hypothetical protein PHH55_08225, partial [Candidatus Delongbacteria bacterium]|nr:hypothetical protein [Candidatus Delongbacteria bacterium]
YSNTITLLGIPSNVKISNDTGNVTVTWDAVTGATSYKIYASDDPYGTYTDISATGTFNGTQWFQAISGNKLFYYVVAGAGDKRITTKETETKNRDR